MPVLKRVKGTVLLTRSSVQITEIESGHRSSCEAFPVFFFYTQTPMPLRDTTNECHIMILLSRYKYICCWCHPSAFNAL